MNPKQKPPDWLENAPLTPLSKALGYKREYPHHLVCNGDRRFPIGTKDKGCSCLGRTKIWSKAEKRFIGMDESL
ncbi:MAG: hypothetical protein M0R32_10495 [Candidatus Cloacimonetes bacterium]|jgi:hypothetical protein|nr:hypothetical protein [Candidatus Cloacimonadota bacterium]